MKNDQYIGVLDACVLVPMPVADTLLRLAEEPAFYSPRWSAEIIKEVERTLFTFGYTAGQVARRLEAMTLAFPEAMVLEDQYHLNPDLFINKLIDQALQIGWTLPRLIANHVPSLARLIKT